MAQTIEEITQELKAAFMADNTLMGHYSLVPGSDFDAFFSKVSFEGRFLYFIAMAVFGVQKLFDIHKLWVNNKALELRRGQTFWYAYIAKQFQFGDTLVFDGDDYTYPTENLAAQVVKFSAATDSGDRVVLKVASTDTNGERVPLSSSEFDALKAFMKKKKIAGTKLVMINRVADKLKLALKIYYDPLVLAADGSLLSDSSIFPAEDAINAYIQELDFNGTFITTTLIDELQSVPGVLNPVFESASAKYGTNPYTSIVDYYTPNAGYLAIDPAYPLSSQLTYLPA